jgi:hypothetical protein
MFAVAYDRKRIKTEFLNMEQFRGARKRILEGLDRIEEGTMIISGEHIRLIPPQGIARLAEDLHERFDDIQVYGYVRKPLAYLDSAFQQVIKNGANYLKPNNIHPLYKGFMKFDRFFGMENVHLSLYERSELEDGDVVIDFCSKIGIPINRDELTKENVSLSEDALKAIYIFRRFGQIEKSTYMKSSKRIALIRELSSIEGKKLHLSRKMHEEMLSDKMDDVRWMEDRLGRTLLDENPKYENTITSFDQLSHISITAIRKIENIVQCTPIAEQSLINMSVDDRIEYTVSLLTKLWIKL